MTRAPLPHWPVGTVAVLVTAPEQPGDAPAAVPVSTALRAGDARIVLALAPGRGSLARLRAHPRCALCLLAAGDVAVTAHGAARVLADPLPGAEGVVAVELLVDELRDHANRRFEIDDGVRWHWTDAEAGTRDASVREALARLAG